MLKQFARYLKPYFLSPIVSGMIPLLVFLLDLLLIKVALYYFPTLSKWAAFGSIVYIFGALIVLLTSYLGYPGDFMLALSLGQTRQEFMAEYIIRRILLIIPAYGMLTAVLWLESILYPTTFPQLQQVYSLFPILIDYRTILLAIPTLIIAPMFLGALYARFGKPVGMILYFLWVGCCILLPQFAENWDAGLPGWLLLIPPAVWCLLGIAVLIVMAVVTIRLGMKQSVR